MVNVLPKLQVAFQGGGGRIGVLLAAAQGVYDATHNKAVLTTLAGTSAGAIAAAILASGRSPEEFRQKLLEIGPKHLPLIERPLSGWNPRLYYRLLSGDPLYNRQAYLDFLSDLFSNFLTDDEYSISPGLKLIFPTADIYGGKLNDRPFDPRTGNISTALLASSAIPFIFHTHKSDTGLIDGGALNNLPVECLGPEEQDGRQLAIMFKERTAKTPKSPLEYILTIASSIVDYNVKQSVSLVNSGNVIQLTTDLSTFSFSEAMAFVASADYKNVRELVRDRVASVVSQGSLAANPPRVSPADELRQMAADIQLVHSNLRRQSRASVKRKIVEYKCFNLLDGNLSRRDLIVIKDHIIAKDAIFAYAASSSAADVVVQGGTPDFDVRDMDGTHFPAVAIGVPETLTAPVPVEYANMMLFFEGALPPDARGYLIQIRGYADQCLYDLLRDDKRFDQVGFQCIEADAIDEVYLVCQIPMGLVPRLRLDDDPGMYDGTETKWHTGRIMREDEFGGIGLALPDPGFRRIGWMAESVKRGEAVGFRASFR